MTRIATQLAAVLTVLATSTAVAFAQPTITFPTPGQVFAAGPDYATDVLQDPWDFNNVEDLSQHPDDYLGWAQSASARSIGPAAFGVGTGKFAATNASNDPAIGLLYAGGIETPNPGRSGRRYPIATASYSKLAFRLKASGATGSSGSAVYWSFNGYGGPVSGPAGGPIVTNGERVYQVDLAAGTNYTSQPRALSLRLDPINDTTPASFELDWVRLTAPDGGTNAAMMTVTAAGCSGAAVVTVTDTAGVPATFNSRTFNYGVLPPGNYEMALSCGGGPASAHVPFSISAPPRVSVLQPDERGGQDYATTMLGNPWDMDQLSDVVSAGNLDQGALVPSPSGGLMIRGRNVLSPDPNITGDPTLFLLAGEGAGRPIASTRYRYLTFTMQLHHPFDLEHGSVARVGWASAPNWSGYTASGTEDILVWPGRNTYTIDLGALTVGDGLDVCMTTPATPNPCLRWPQASPRYLRLDPHEFFDRQVEFDVDNVTLTAPDEILQGGTFPIQWSVADAVPGSVANIYYDSDANLASTAGRVLIQGGIPAGAGTFNWQVPPTLASGDYYIYVEIAAPGSPNPSTTRGTYSTGILRVIPTNNSPVVTIADVASGGTVNAPFNISGCAYNGATGTAADEVIVYAHPLNGQMSGVVQLLGLNPAGGLGTLSPAACGSGPGYRITNVFGLSPGQWTLRVLARNTLTGDFDEVQAQNVTVAMTAAPARNLRAAISGNTVTLNWDPPIGGSALTQYRVEAANNATFSPFTPIVLSPNQTSIAGTLGNGTYYIRIVTGNVYTTEGPASNVVSFTLPVGAGATTPPGPPVLSATQVITDPIRLDWTPGPGGAPASYTLLVGMAPGNYIYAFPMGAANVIVSPAPPGRFYARVEARNDAGRELSNEITFAIAAPAPPVMQPPSISGRNVSLAWTAPAGAISYHLVVRIPGQNAVLLTTPVAGAGLYVPDVPSGAYAVSVIAVNSVGLSGESNTVIVNIP